MTDKSWAHINYTIIISKVAQGYLFENVNKSNFEIIVFQFKTLPYTPNAG